MKVKIIIVVLAAVILVAARIGYVALYPSASDTAGGSNGIAAKVRAERESGVKFIVRLAKEGNLPGINKGDHESLSANAGRGTYPYSMTFQLIKTGDTSRYHYKIMQDAKDSEWKLERAWHTDVKGNLIEEWPVQ